MRWAERITLIATTTVKDPITRQERLEPTPRVVRVNPWTISYDERTMIGTADRRGALRYEIMTRVYKGERLAEVKGRKYNVDHEEKGFRTILTLTEVGHDI